MNRDFLVIAVAPGGVSNSSTAVAAARAGFTGIVDLEQVTDQSIARNTLVKAALSTAGALGMRLNGQKPASWAELPEHTPANARTAILTYSTSADLKKQIKLLKGHHFSVLVEALNLKQALDAEKAGADAVIAKGNEAAGFVSEQTTLILLQQLVAKLKTPVLAQGGIGIHTAAACRVAGAAGVVLDWQLALLAESQLPEKLKTRLAQLEGRETRCLGQTLEMCCRLYAFPGVPVLKELEDLETRLRTAPKRDKEPQWRQAIAEKLAAAQDSTLLALSQDVCFASRWARKYRTVQAALSTLHKGLALHISAAQATKPLAQGRGSAPGLGIRYPVIQGPMSRVSDTAAFAKAVADAGGLPMLAGAMMAPPELEPVLAQTRAALQDKPWGIGLLGFIDREFYQQQLELVRQYKPSAAIIAGGSPAQAAELESAGISAYIHVPADRLLAHFIRDGARKFVFEGRECGGHIGPFASFVLWENAVETLLEEIPEAQASRYDVWFAGGIHDARSAAMVSALAAPLAQRGMAVGALVGTAYLLTGEAVASGAISQSYQDCLLHSDSTCVLDSGGGYEVRTAPCPFVDKFEEEKERLRQEGKGAEEVRKALELLNLGRLRVAAKGVVFNLRSLKDPAEPLTLPVPPEQQKQDGIFMAGQILPLHRTVTSISALHEALCTDSAKILDNAAGAVPARLAGARNPEHAVAIVGMACLFPKAPNLRQYWENILNSVYAVQEIPPDRWDWRLYYDENRNARDKIYSRWGGFLDPILFDPTRFRIPPNSLRSIDPLQLLPLEAVRQALADAGYDKKEFDRQRTSVIFGVAGGMGDRGLMYGVRSTLPLLFESVPEETLAQLPEWTEISFPGILANVVAGRIANCFDLGGANFTVDAACGSGLTAVYSAVREILSGACDTAIAGACDVVQNPFGFLCFARTQALSPSGRPRPFDASADGISISEGVAAAVLKRLDLAERDGDRIYAVIRGVGASSDGSGASLTSPQTRGQLRALRQAYSQAGFSMNTLGMLEAHGTGTTLGDGVEARSLRQALQEDGTAPRTCAVGSVKSMIGHTKGCAGMAGLLKTALSVYHGVLPPTLGVEKPSPADCWDEQSPIYLNTKTRPWLSSGEPRRAGVDAFGFGGSNFHTVLEAHTTAEADSAFPLDTWPCELFCWSGETPEAIRTALAETARALDAGAPAALRDLARTLTRRHLNSSNAEPRRLRLALVAESTRDLREKIEIADKALAGNPATLRDARGIFYSARPLAADGKVAFLFPGQGSQTVDMLRDLTVLFAELRHSFSLADRTVGARLPQRLSAYVYPPSRFTPEEEKAALARLTSTDVAQPALAAAAMGCQRILGLLGVTPDMTAGHSLGEYMALCAAGVLTEEALYDVLTERGAAIVRLGKGDLGAMLAVKAGPEAVEPRIQGLSEVYLANLNSPTQTILSGRKETLEKLSEQLKADGIQSQLLRVSCAFHSPFVAPAREAVAAKLQTADFGEALVPAYSNSLGAAYPAAPEEARALLSKHLVSSVRFTEEIRAMHKDGARVFIEVGPGNVLSNLADQILTDQPHITVPLNRKDPRGDLFPFLQALAELAAEGVAMDLAPLFSRRNAVELNPATLQPLKTEKVNGSVAWLLAPDTVWPASQPKPVIRRTALAAGNAGPAAAMPAKLPAAGPETAAVVARHQQIMRKFLEQQQTLMMALLGGQAPAAIPVLPAMPATPAAAAAPCRPVCELAAPTPAPAAAPAAPSASAFSRDSVHKNVLDVISEKTGYPADMLTPEQTLEADLGIDSIKRVEILREIRLKVAGYGIQIEAGGLSDCKTLREIIDRICTKTPAPPVAPVSPVVQTQPATPAAVSAAPAATALSRDSIHKNVLDVISEKTGYPADMLTPEQTLEADLGIDSIKRVEILREIRLKVAGHGIQIEAGGLSDCKTLREITDRICTKMPAAASNSTAPANNAAPRFLVRSRAAAIPAGAPAVKPGSLVIISEDEIGLAEALDKELTRLGAKVVRLSDRVSKPGVIPVDFTDSATLSQTLKKIRAQHGLACAYLHLLPLRKSSPTPANLDAWRKQLQRDVKSLFRVAREVAPDLRIAGAAGAAWLFGATGLADRSAGSADPGAAGIAGLLKTLALEWPEVACRAVHLDLSIPVPELAALWLAEMNARQSPAEAAYVGRQRHVFALQPATAGDPKPEPAAQAGAVILITGGAVGITAEVAHELAPLRPTLILLGRSAMPQAAESPDTAKLATRAEVKAALIEQARRANAAVRPAEIEASVNRLFKDREIRENLARLRQAGATVHYLQADAREERELTGALDHVYRTFGRLDGVIHGVGLIEDTLLENKTDDSFNRVFDCKADSVFLLTRALRLDSLRFLVLFSSVSGTFGNRGQADYAAANEVLNQIAQEIDRRIPGRVLALNWGPWDKTGMVTPEVKRQFELRGIQVISPEAGRRAFLEELQSGRKGNVTVVVGDGPWGRRTQG